MSNLDFNTPEMLNRFVQLVTGDDHRITFSNPHPRVIEVQMSVSIKGERVSASYCFDTQVAKLGTFTQQYLAMDHCIDMIIAHVRDHS